MKKRKRCIANFIIKREGTRERYIIILCGRVKRVRAIKSTLRERRSSRCERGARGRNNIVRTDFRYSRAGRCRGLGGPSSLAYRPSLFEHFGNFGSHVRARGTVEKWEIHCETSEGRYLNIRDNARDYTNSERRANVNFTIRYTLSSFSIRTIYAFTHVQTRNVLDSLSFRLKIFFRVKTLIPMYSETREGCTRDLRDLLSS